MIFNTLSIITLVLSLLLGLFVYANNKKHIVNKSFLLMVVGMILWIFCNFMADISKDLDFIELWSKASSVGPLFIGYFFYRLSLYFPITKNINTSFEVAVRATILVILVLIPTKLNVQEVYFVEQGVPTVTPGPLYAILAIFFLVLVATAFRYLYSGYSELDRYQKLQVQYISFGFGISALLALVTNALFPFLGHSEFVNYGAYFVLFFIFFSSYAIIRYKMFDIKIVAAQLLVYSLWIFVLIRTLVSSDIQDRFVNGGLLVILIVLGTFLIRSVIKEVSQRERIEKLAKDLQSANDRLTELDRQKSEFVSFATHQLRAPLTAMKGYSSLILEGDMGRITPETKEAVSRIFESSNTLASIVDDYLNITRIELGTMKYAFETINLKTLIEDVIAELKPSIEKAKDVKFSFDAQNADFDYRITADRDKLKQVIANLIDNAFKYTPRGWIQVSLSFDKEKHKFIFRVKDNGIGIAPEILPRLFQKFTRASNANKTNIKGTGLGLFVAKEIITSHHAEIRAESAGEGKGSTFTVVFEPFAKA